MTSSVPTTLRAPAPLWRRAFDWWLVQVKHVLPPTIFFFFGFAPSARSGYRVCVFVFRIAEGMWHFVLEGGAPGDFPSFRQRIRLLTRLNRLTEANPVEVISERGSAAHTELIGILHKLAARPGEENPEA